MTRLFKMFTIYGIVLVLLHGTCIHTYKSEENPTDGLTSVNFARGLGDQLGKNPVRS